LPAQFRNLSSEKNLKRLDHLTDIVINFATDRSWSSGGIKGGGVGGGASPLLAHIFVKKAAFSV